MTKEPECYESRKFTRIHSTDKTKEGPFGIRDEKSWSKNKRKMN